MVLTTFHAIGLTGRHAEAILGVRCPTDAYDVNRNHTEHERLPLRVERLLQAAHVAQLSGENAVVHMGGATYQAGVEQASLDAGRKRDYVRLQLKITLPRDESLPRDERG